MTQRNQFKKNIFLFNFMSLGEREKGPTIFHLLTQQLCYSQELPSDPYILLDSVPICAPQLGDFKDPLHPLDK